MTIVDVSGSAPQVIATITVPNVPNLPNPVPASVVAVTALPDESRAYVASVPTSAQPSEVSISAVQGDGKTATYTYVWTGGHDLTPGITVEVTGIASPNDVFNGTYVVDAVSGSSCNQPAQGCTFQAANSTTANRNFRDGDGGEYHQQSFPPGQRGECYLKRHYKDDWHTRLSGCHGDWLAILLRCVCSAGFADSSDSLPRNFPLHDGGGWR